MGHEAAGVLAGRRAWIISDGKAGHEIQMLGVADALSVAAEVKRIAEPRGFYKLTAPYGRPPHASRFGAPGSVFAPPWPVIAFATGRLTTPYIRALKRRAGLQTFTVILLDPKTGPRSADLFWVPEHDARRGANVVTTLASPHRYSAERLARLRAETPQAIAALPAPRIAVLIGGPNGDYRYGGEDTARLAEALAAIAGSGAGLMITASRRTPPGLLAAVDQATAAAHRIVWSGDGDNPYPYFLANADAFVVTADSINMVGEAAATGKPIYVFHPAGGSAKFDRFHAAMSAKGITRALSAPFVFETWSYAPLDCAGAIAREIERRFVARARMIPGLCQ
ncbi:MAG TPA: mitochondrial fission ELM1 family protein [Hyphomicrobium sp.]|nr:mitochondrial fission ELM1 family protein [Hyphomicrobium sp.]